MDKKFSMQKDTLREVQRRLKDEDLYHEDLDGKYGPATDTALNALFDFKGLEGKTWPKWRKTVAGGQIACLTDGIDAGKVDGLLGPQTQYAFEVYDSRDPEDAQSWRDDEDHKNVPPPPPPAVEWPKERDVRNFFGAEGANQTSIILPFPMRIAWDLSQTVMKVLCNKRVAAPMTQIWQRTFDHYGLTRIKELGLDLFGGCLNVRKKRGGSGWSMHAYGIAWDVDPEHNQLKWGRDRASLDAKDYDFFWGFVEAEGAVSLGRAKNYDWMHFQFARL